MVCVVSCTVIYVGSGGVICVVYRSLVFFFFQAEDGIRDLVRSRGLGDVYKRQAKPKGPGHSRPLACRHRANSSSMMAAA